MNIPNILTLIRLLLIPVIVVVHYLGYPWTNVAAAAIFMVASFTDWFDGYLARRLNQTTPFGAFLDPVADKVMVAVALAILIEKFNTPLMTVPGLIIIGREIVISALREWMAELGKRTSVAVNFIGKLKTTAQMGSITLLLFAKEMGTGLAGMAGMVLLVIAAILTIWSMFVYLRAAWPDLNPFDK
ncbi:CDP-diacylglycerol--glycerol-3-phosphate 3-phosphatidyltransferase [Sansalvadorimonas sp. 2012CJ34-2]|uniref:CDP-diacylglycerol--glycerol-3-phosphate 3-phosphatidyltransferase n=1 Tax=Parendozoicomonas callyspongiae TaxID=2942213 RepID=A0ABT0PEX9_9GAMM|nr:CDP-diacylglycerol--glycerol-3-phosphate 3-phosphatidyltransferase [Sansalvadorimonas sp. 2012CJ34-2]MCL6269875.1 CDP-diacylglycerol--glycerol-3-phosphate 3-phosphatidyltransferase [Sansalvadorimonas sp. 2012CJ34-2]